MTKNPASVSQLKLKEIKSGTIKSIAQSLASRSNQDRISKSNTAPQLSRTVVNYKNAKEHLKNNQRELPRLIANISATSLELK